MLDRSLTAPDGRTYQVAVEWLPRWRGLADRLGDRFGGRWSRTRRQRRRDEGASWWDGLDLPLIGDADDLLAGLATLFVVIMLGLLLWWLLLPLLLLVLDGLAVAVLVLLGLVARVAFRRPWTVAVWYIDPETGGRTVTRIRIVGWRRAVRARDTIVSSLRAGASLRSATSLLPGLA
jgi:hypothetical protein